MIISKCSSRTEGSKKNKCTKICL